MKLKLLAIILGLVVMPFLVLAEGTPEPGNDPSVYLFHLYYDNGQLSTDPDFQFAYDIITEEFVLKEVDDSVAYRGDIINLTDKVNATFKFDLQNGDPDFNQGKTSVKGPYFADADHADFYNPAGQKILTISLKTTSFCNDDKICNSTFGEDYNNCPSDCKAPSSTPFASLKPPKPSTTPPAATGGGDKLAILVVVVAAILGGWLGWRWFKKRRTPAAPTIPSAMPPTAPPSSTPPTVPPAPPAS